ncbi:MAG: hypothetical protein K8W52_18680 [Deltaproteobacteria bacterium]|nr:hypothetical protein [Deltaproteobacteria bacterium]
MKPALFLAFVLMFGCGSSKPAPSAPPVAAPAEVAAPADAVAPAPEEDDEAEPTNPFSREALDTTPVIVPDAAPPPPPEEAVVDCGCGCCGGVAPANACVYHSKGESLDTLRARFAKRPSAYDCRNRGCSRGTRYHYCD